MYLGLDPKSTRTDLTFASRLIVFILDVKGPPLNPARPTCRSQDYAKGVESVLKCETGPEKA